MRFALPVLVLAPLVGSGCSSPDGETIIQVHYGGRSSIKGTVPIQLKEYDRFLSRAGIWVGHADEALTTPVHPSSKEGPFYMASVFGTEAGRRIKNKNDFN